jgi:hypothetical protein
MSSARSGWNEQRRKALRFYGCRWIRLGHRRLTVRVKREQALDSGAWVWTGLPDGYPGSAGGRTVAELFEEVEALKHFMTGDDPATDIRVDYLYEVADIPVEVLVDYHHGRVARDKAAENLRRANEDLSMKARATASALRASSSKWRRVVQ